MVLLATAVVLLAVIASAIIYPQVSRYLRQQDVQRALHAQAEQREALIDQLNSISGTVVHASDFREALAASEPAWESDVTVRLKNEGSKDIVFLQGNLSVSTVSGVPLSRPRIYFRKTLAPDRHADVKTKVRSPFMWYPSQLASVFVVDQIVYSDGSSVTRPDA